MGLGRWPLVDSGVQIDQVRSRLPGRVEVDDNITVTVEAAGVPHVGIVVRRDVDVVVIGPADTFQVNRDRRPRWPGSR